MRKSRKNDRGRPTKGHDSYDCVYRHCRVCWKPSQNDMKPSDRRRAQDTK